MIDSTNGINQHCSLQWSDQDDQKLLQGIQYHGDNWESVADFFNKSRTSEECQNRYNHFWKKYYSIHTIQIGSSVPVKVLSVSQRTHIQVMSTRTSEKSKSENVLPSSTVNVGLRQSPKRKSDGDLSSQSRQQVAKKEKKERNICFEETCRMQQDVLKLQGDADFDINISPTTVALLDHAPLFSDDEVDYLISCLE